MIKERDEVEQEKNPDQEQYRSALKLKTAQSLEDNRWEIENKYRLITENTRTRGEGWGRYCIQKHRGLSQLVGRMKVADVQVVKAKELSPSKQLELES